MIEQVGMLPSREKNPPSFPGGLGGGGGLGGASRFLDLAVAVVEKAMTVLVHGME